MKSVKLYQPGKALLGDFPEPQITRDDEVKIRVRYCTINADDYDMYSAKIKGRYPDYGILNEFSGEIVALGNGSKAAGLSVGDHVSSIYYYPCGMCPMCRKNRPDLCLELRVKAALSEYIVLNNRAVTKLPEEISLREGVLFGLAVSCMQGVERMNVQPGDKVLIHGGGSVGLMMMELVQKKLPSLVVVSEPLSEKRNLALQLGADCVWNPVQDNLAEETLRVTEGFGFNHIVDAAGTLEIMPYTVNLLGRGGNLLLFSNYSPGDILPVDLAEIYWKDYSIISAYHPTYEPYTANADFMKQLTLEPLIGTEYPIEKVNDAFAAYASRRYQKILIRV